LLAQARLAARNGINLDTILRRYFAGYTLLGDFLMQEAEDGGLLGGSALKRLLRVQAALFDRLIAAVTEEYTRESEGRLDTVEQCRAERVERLLAGELLDTSEFASEFDAHHLGVIAAGLGVAEPNPRPRQGARSSPPAHSSQRGNHWAWLGTRRPLDVEELVRHLTQSWPAQVSLAIGESGQGLAGWRLTHQQARAALPIALRSPESFVRYTDVALRLDAPRRRPRHLDARALPRSALKGARWRRRAAATLRAYFTAERNVSSAAAALGVSRQTVINRLRAIEERLARPVGSCAAEMDAALRLEDLGYPLLPRAAFSSV
jgi:hypothetical protein